VAILEKENLDLASKNLSLEEELLNLKETQLDLQSKPATASQQTETPRAITSTQAAVADIKSNSYLDMKQQIFEMKEQITQDESSIENLSKLILQRDTEIDTISKKLESLEESKIASPKKILPQPGRPLLQTTSAQLLLSQKEAEIDKLRDTVDQLASELDHQKETASKVQSRLDLAAAENAELTKSLRIKETQIQQIKSELESVSQKSLALNQSLLEAQKNCQYLQEKLSEKENQNLVIKHTIKSQDDQITSQSYLIDHLREAASKADASKSIEELKLRAEELEKELQQVTEALELSNSQRLKDMQEFSEQFSQKDNEIRGLKQQVEYERKKSLDKQDSDKLLIKNIESKSQEKDRLMEQLALKNRQLLKEIEDNKQALQNLQTRPSAEQLRPKVQRTDLHDAFSNISPEVLPTFGSPQNNFALKEPQLPKASNRPHGQDLTNSVEFDFREQPNFKIVDESSAGPEFYKSPFPKAQALAERATSGQRPGKAEPRASDFEVNREENRSYFSRLYSEGVRPEIGRSTIERVATLYEKHMKILEETSSKFIRKPIGKLTLERVELLETEVSRLAASRERHRIRNMHLESVLAARKPREDSLVAAERLNNAKRQILEQQKSLEIAQQESHQNWEKYLLSMQETEHLRELTKIPLEMIEDISKNFADMKGNKQGIKLQFGSKPEKNLQIRTKGNIHSFKSEGDREENPLEEYFPKRTPAMKNFIIDDASFIEPRGHHNEVYSRSKSDLLLPPKKN